MENSKELHLLINNLIQEEVLRKIVFSNPIHKSSEYKKIVVQAFQGKKEITFQIAFFFGTKVKHENYLAENLAEALLLFLNQYKQWQILTVQEQIQVLVNKKLNFKISRMPLNNEKVQVIPSHNRKKQYILEEGNPIPWMVHLGIMNEKGVVLADKQKKFKQINRFLEMVEDVVEDIPKGSEIVDFGCGKSYLTFAMYYFLNVIKDKEVRIVGLDLKEDVVEYCQSLAEVFGFSPQLSFSLGDIAKYKATDTKPHMIVTLHACDTATDYALYHAITWGSKIIMSVPCCQHELFSQIESVVLEPMLKHGILKERFSALLTDGIRASLLESYGYQCSVIEFIDMAHTPKNILIRGIKKQQGRDEAKWRECEHMMEMFHTDQTLFRLLKENI